MENNNEFNNINNNNNGFNNIHNSNNNGKKEPQNSSYVIEILLFSGVVSCLFQSYVLFMILMIIAFISKDKFFKVIGKIVLFVLVVVVIIFGVCIFSISRM